MILLTFGLVRPCMFCPKSNQNLFLPKKSEARYTENHTNLNENKRKFLLLHLWNIVIILGQIGQLIPLSVNDMTLVMRRGSPNV
jgi:hypothetical protein